MTLTAEEIRILIEWFDIADNYTNPNHHTYTDLLEKLRAELRRVDEN